LNETYSIQQLYKNGQVSPFFNHPQQKNPLFSTLSSLYSHFSRPFHFINMIAFKLALLVLFSSLVTAIPGWGTKSQSSSSSSSSSAGGGYGYGSTSSSSTCKATTVTSTYVTSRPYTTVSDVCTTQTVPFTTFLPSTRTFVTTSTTGVVSLSSSLTTGYTAYTTSTFSTFNATQTSLCTTYTSVTDSALSTSTSIITQTTVVPITSVITRTVTETCKPLATQVIRNI